MALSFMPRPEHLRLRPQAQGQGYGWTVPRPRLRNLALRPRLNIPGLNYTKCNNNPNKNTDDSVILLSHDLRLQANNILHYVHFMPATSGLKEIP